MVQVLEDIRVIDMGHVAAVPSAASLLGDLGAEVLKVEPVDGEWIRHYKGHMEADPLVQVGDGEVHWMIELFNRGKKGLAVNLRSAAGREILHRLIEGADVFVSNYEVGTLSKLDLAYETLRSINPRLVYAVLTGFGTRGPDREKRGFDQLLWGRAGLSESITEPGANLVIMRPAMCDRIAGDHLVMGVLAALLVREKTGEGQKLDLSLFHSALWTLGMDIQPALLGAKGRKFDRRRSRNPLANVYRTRDDRWLMLSMLQPDEDWSRFCRTVERPDLEADPRFATQDLRARNCEELIRIFDDIFAEHDLAEWLTRLEENGCIFERVQTFEEVVEDPQALANDFFTDVPHPAAGKLRYLTAPVQLDRTPPEIRGTAPALGEHTEEVLLAAGYSEEDVARFRDEGVIV